MNYFFEEWFTPAIIAQFLNLVVLLALFYKFFKWCFPTIKSRKNDDDFIDFMD